jgi:SAM-dependent methyltransferase
MDVTNRYVLQFCRDFADRHGPARILDYGCGAGKLVAAGRAAGLDLWGADVYYAGSRTREEAAAAGLLGTAIREMTGEKIDWLDRSFDLVVNNQVMEHVADLDRTLAEIDRVLKPGGAVLSVFPSRDVWREGHIGIPFSHWFPKGSRLRFLYTWALRTAGLGYWKEQAPTARQWALDKLDWIDRFTRYRPRREIFAAYDRRFANELREADYIEFRLLDRPGRAWIASALRFAPFRRAACALFRKLAFLVIVSRKPA